jgi:hypothetical protein
MLLLSLVGTLSFLLRKKRTEYTKCNTIWGLGDYFG